MARVVSDRVRQFGERFGDPLATRCIDGEFAVSAANVLHEGVPSDDHSRGPIGSPAAHRSEPVFELAVGGFDRVVRVAFDVMPRGCRSSARTAG
jgi:hypothetical protein